MIELGAIAKPVSKKQNYSSQNFLMIIRFFGYDEKGNLVKTLTSDENGLIKDKVPFSKKYIVKIDNDKFEPMSTSIENSFKGIENQTFSSPKHVQGEHVLES
jgi:hypothetical protein